MFAVLSPIVLLVLHFLQRHFSFPKAQSIQTHFINYFFFFLLWNNFSFRSREHLRYKIGWSQKPDYFPFFVLWYYPQSTMKHRPCLHLSFLLINFRFCQCNKSMIARYFFPSSFSTLDASIIKITDYALILS